MASILKNQILKLLSKFAKNVSPSSLNVSALKGEGELHNLELNEKVLTELLELPSWMQISHASVNKVSLKIQWTKLKSTPIQMILDEVNISMETCSELRPPEISQDFGSYKSGGKYGFSDKVIDGMTVSINAVFIKFKNISFVASLQLSRITLCSKSPVWQKTDLRLTRLKDPHQQHVLIFKELSWQTLKIEARSTKYDLIPVRLITGMSCCRITIKKKLSDCSVIGCRLVLIMDDIMWVLTDSQLLASYHFINSLSDLIKKATEESQKVKAARKLESIPSYQPQYSQNLGDYGIGIQSYPVGKDETSKGSFWNAPSPAQIQYKLQVFKKFDVVETSYHLFSEKIELHFLDDPGPGRSTYPELKEGAILQVSLQKAKIDYYPYHLATGDRTHWIKYEEGNPYQWTKSALNQFKSKLFESFSGKNTSHTPLGRASPHGRSNSFQSQMTASSIMAEMEFGNEGIPVSSTKTFVSNQFRKLMSTCCIVTCHDIIVYGVIPSKSKAAPKEILSGEKTRLSLPTSPPFIQLEVSFYFYPGGFSFPVPPPKIYMQACPLQLTFDMKTLLWLNAFACNLIKRVNAKKTNPPYLDIHIEALMPRVIIEPILGSITTMEGSRKFLQAQVSRAVISNVRETHPTNPGSRSSLFTCLEAAQSGQLFFGSEFPSRSGDLQAIPSKFLDHALGNDALQNSLITEAKFQPPYDSLHSESLWTEARDVFFFYFDPLWVEFVGPPNAKGRPISFIDSFNLSVWLYAKDLSLIPSSIASSPVSVAPSDAERSLKGLHPTKVCSSPSKDALKSSPEASLQMLAYTPSLVSAQMGHQQYVLILRVLDTIAEFTTFLTHDTKEISGNEEEEEETLLVAAVVPQVDLSLLLSSQTLPEDSVLTGLVQQMACGEFFTSSQLLSEKALPCDPYVSVANDTARKDAFALSQGHLEGAAIPSIHREYPSADATPRLMSPSDGCCPSEPASPSPNTVGEGAFRCDDAASKGSDEDFSPHQGAERSFLKSRSAGCLVTSSPSRDHATFLTTSPVNVCSTSITHASPSTMGDGPTAPLPSVPPPATPRLDKGEALPLNPSQEKRNYGFLYVKKGFTSGINALMNTFDQGVKSPDDDAMSTHSDMSNESDNFVMLFMNDKQPNETAGGESLFCVGDKSGVGVAGDFGIEAADEVVENSSYNPTDASSQMLKDLVSVMTVQLGKVHTVYEGQGHNSTLKMQFSSINCEEYTEVSYQDFQASFHNKGRNWSSFHSNGHPCSIKIRLDTTASEIIPAATSPDQASLEFPKCSKYAPPLPSLPNNTLQSNGVLPAAKAGLLVSGRGGSPTKKDAAGNPPLIPENTPSFHPSSDAESASNFSVPTSPVASESLDAFNSTRMESPPYLEGRYSTALPVKRFSSLDAELANVSFSLYTTSLAALLDLIEDDILPQPLPFKAKIEGVELQMKEDKKLLHLSSPVSYKVTFPELLLIRDAEFNVTLLPFPAAWENEQPSSRVGLARDSDSASQLSALKQELDDLKRLLKTSEEENLNLRKALKILQGEGSL